MHQRQQYNQNYYEHPGRHGDDRYNSRNHQQQYQGSDVRFHQYDFHHHQQQKSSLRDYRLQDRVISNQNSIRSYTHMPQRIYFINNQQTYEDREYLNIHPIKLVWLYYLGEISQTEYSNNVQIVPHHDGAYVTGSRSMIELSIDYLEKLANRQYKMEFIEEDYEEERDYTSYYEFFKTQTYKDMRTVRTSIMTKQKFLNELPKFNGLRINIQQLPRSFVILFAQALTFESQKRQIQDFIQESKFNKGRNNNKINYIEWLSNLDRRDREMHNNPRFRKNDYGAFHIDQRKQGSFQRQDYSERYKNNRDHHDKFNNIKVDNDQVRYNNHDIKYNEKNDINYKEQARSRSNSDQQYDDDDDNNQRKDQNDQYQRQRQDRSNSNDRSKQFKINDENAEQKIDIHEDQQKIDQDQSQNRQQPQIENIVVYENDLSQSDSKISDNQSSVILNSDDEIPIGKMDFIWTSYITKLQKEIQDYKIEFKIIESQYNEELLQLNFPLNHDGNNKDQVYKLLEKELSKKQLELVKIKIQNVDLKKKKLLKDFLDQLQVIDYEILLLDEITQFAEEIDKSYNTNLVTYLTSSFPKQEASTIIFLISPPNLIDLLITNINIWEQTLIANPESKVTLQNTCQTYSADSKFDNLEFLDQIDSNQSDQEIISTNLQKIQQQSLQYPQTQQQEPSLLKIYQNDSISSSDKEN